MDFIEFNEQNTVFAKDQFPYKPLPVYKCENPQGEIIFKIKLNKEELDKLNEDGGEMFCSMYMFGAEAITPIAFHVESPFVTIYEINQVDSESLKAILKTGSKLGNFHVGRDIILFEVVQLTEEQERFTLRLYDSRGMVINNKFITFEQFSILISNCKHSDKWFIINPKNG